MDLDASVIICAHNPRHSYLSRVLEALQNQTLQRERWELVLVDNASDARLIDSFDLRWHPNGRHVREEVLGLTQARLRGISETRSDLIIFVDDDNVLDADYLEQAARIAAERPYLGAWGGRILPEFEVPPAKWTEPWWGLLAVE